MTPELPTPLTDAAANAGVYCMPGDDPTKKHIVRADFARNLERCLAVAEGALNRVQRGLCYPDEYRDVADEALAQIAKMKGQSHDPL